MGEGEDKECGSEEKRGGRDDFYIICGWKQTGAAAWRGAAGAAAAWREDG